MRFLQSLIPIILFVGLTAGLSACGGGGGGSGGGGGGATPGPFSTFQAAIAVIGQADFTGVSPNQGSAMPGDNTLKRPIGAPAEGSLYLADQENHRILGFNAIPTTSNASADFVIGQTSFASNTSGTSANTFDFPYDTVTADGKLFVLDFDNRRVLIWNSLPTSNNDLADVVVGAPDFTTLGGGTASQMTMDDPVSMAVAGGHLFVTDASSHRVLIWNSIPDTDNEPADVVLGQVNFVENFDGLTDSKFNFPFGVWSDGVRVAVADSVNNRVLIWNTLPTTNGTPADLVIGQPDFMTKSAGTGAKGLNNPFDVHSNGLQFFVTDSDNHRVLVYNDFPTVDQPSADVVIGQSSFTNVTPDDDDQDGIPDATPSARTLRRPIGISTIGNDLFVTAYLNHRVLIYRGQ
jgi:hypothetical protein